MEFNLLEAPIQLTRSDLEFQQKIGDGAFGCVWRVKNKTTGSLFALKIVQKSKVSKILPQFLREVSIMYELSHPHIVKLHTHFEDQKNFYLLMELLEGGSLFHKLFKERSLSESKAKNYFSQITSAIHYLHTRSPPIIHRDIKPENILLDSKGHIKVTDFGWANYLAPTRNTTCGTLEYLPPEIIEERNHDLSLDIWCLGILLYEMLCGTTPFKAIMEEMLKYNITKGYIRFPQKVSEEAKFLIGKMLEKNQQNRFTIEDVRKNSWVNGERCGNNEDKQLHRFNTVGNLMQDKLFDRMNTMNSYVHECGSSKSTKESFCAEDSQKKEDFSEELVNARERLGYLEDRISSLKGELSKAAINEKSLVKSIYESDLELRHLNATDSITALSDLIINTKKLISDKTQICKKQNFVLERLKKTIEEKSREIKEKEESLMSLQHTGKSINIGFSRIKTYKSLDISTLKIDLDVIQSQLSGRSSFDESSFISLKDARSYITSNVNRLKILNSHIYEDKIEKCNEQSADLNQKITELTIYYSDFKGKIMQGFRKVREELLKVQKKTDEHATKQAYHHRSQVKLTYKHLLSQAKSQENPTGVSESLLIATQSRLIVSIMQDLKKDLNEKYVKIKAMRKERFRTRESIDIKDMEIDDIKFEIDKMKTISRMKTWSY